MRKRPALAYALAFGLLTAGCGQTDFGSSDEPRRAAPPPDEQPPETAPPEASGPAAPETADALGTPGEAAAVPVAMTPALLTDLLAGDPNADALAACLEGWGTQTGLSEAAVRSYRTLRSSGTGFSATKIEDGVKTKEPSLVLIESDDVGFSSVELKLGNPNGYYCIKTSSTGFGNRRIAKHCRAVIGSDVNDAVGFSQDAVAEFGDDCG